MHSGEHLLVTKLVHFNDYTIIVVQCSKLLNSSYAGVPVYLVVSINQRA